MKKQLFIFICLFFIGKQIKSQTWSTLGNTLTGSEIFGGTSGSFPLTIQNAASQPINFSTGGTQRMTILGTGNVGTRNL